MNSRRRMQLGGMDEVEIRSSMPVHCTRGECHIIGTALAIGLGVASAAGAIGSSAIGAHAAGSAADAQSAALQHGYDLQHADNQAALAFQQKQYAQQQKDLAPWLQSGTGAINTLYSNLKAGKYGPWTGSFSAPTAADAQQDPGYTFRVSEGLKALDRGAASHGGILTGGTLKAEQQFGQDMASQEYGNVYNRRFQEYLQKYGEFNNNQTSDFNRYASIAGVGQQAANTSAQVGQQAAGNVTNILSNDGTNALNAYGNIGNARASGYINGANAWMSGIGGATNGLSQYLLLSQLNGGGGNPNWVGNPVGR